MSAHTADESYLHLRVDGARIEGRLDLARRDLQQGIALKGIDIGSLDQEDILRREEALALDIVAALATSANGRRLQVTITDFTTLALNGGEYTRTLFELSGWEEPLVIIEIYCGALTSIDKSMHGLIQVEHGGRTEAIAYNSGMVSQRFTLNASPGKWNQARTFVIEGIRHIWMGFDHILFLMVLLIPSVLRYYDTAWCGIERLRPALVKILKIVTAFTVAHSMTLTLSALAIVKLPTRLVESAIAASVILAASNNLFPWFHGRGWVIAFAFGLIHGFGFANVLGDLGLAKTSFATALIGFNVGVELGQLAIVTAFLPIAFTIRNGWCYRVVILKFASAGVSAIAGVWMFERAFEINLLPF